VEKYYKGLELIEPRLKSFFWDPPVMVAGFFWGVLRWPFIAVADYKYNHNSVYRAKVDRMDEEKEALKTAYTESLKKKLDDYIKQDLSKEASVPPVKTAAAVIPPEAAPVVKAEPSITPAAMPEPVIQESVVSAPPVAREPEAAEPAKKVETEEASPAVVVQPHAVITVSASKGLSPFKVKFSGQKSYSESGKIVSYFWDFGDGDTSDKKNPENTYWSTTYGTRSFTVTLTVKDQSGAESSATSVIEVITH
jgi:hypothetical protein